MKGKPEITITSKNQISLPVASLKELGWQRGDKLVVNVLSDGKLVLMKRPESWTDFYSGKMGGVWGDHEDTLRYLDEERASWNERFPDPDSDGD